MKGITKNKDSEKKTQRDYTLSEEDKKFLSIVHNASLRKALLERLRDLGELPAFQQLCAKNMRPDSKIDS